MEKHINDKLSLVAKAHKMLSHNTLSFTPIFFMESMCGNIHVINPEEWIIRMNIINLAFPTLAQFAKFLQNKISRYTFKSSDELDFKSMYSLSFE